MRLLCALYKKRSNPFPYFFFHFLFFGVLFLLIPEMGYAQNNRLVNTHNWRYTYIQQLQQRGFMHELNPSDLPYTYRDIREALDAINTSRLEKREKTWYDMLQKSVPEPGTNADEMRYGGLFTAGVRHSSSDRLNTINPKGDGEALLPRGQLNGYLEWKNWIGQAGITFDLFYDKDPDGLDTARRLYIRSEETYMGYTSRLLDVYVGRFDNQWAPYGRRGSILTDNPRAFDQIQIEFGSSTISFSSIVGELDSMKPDSTFGGAFEEGATRRFLFLHRLDWSPVSNLKLSLMEGELYYSQTAGISIRNLIPLHTLLFESHNAPMNNESNLILGAGIWYQTGPLTLFFQGTLDDVDLEYKGAKKTKTSPYTINISAAIADIANTFDLGVETDWISANSYRSNTYPNQWTYAQRGLASNFSDYIRTKIYATFYPPGLAGLQVQPAVTFYSKGEADLRELRETVKDIDSSIPGILTGTIERTVRPSVYLRFQPPGTPSFGPNSTFNFWIDADIGVNFVENTDNIEGASDERFIGLFRVFAQVAF